MKTNIVISLDTRRSKRDGTFPLVMRLGHNERTTSIPLGVSVKEKDWDAKNRIVKKTYEGVSSVTRLNNLIQKRKADAMDIILKLHEDGRLENLPLVALREKIDNQNASHSFFKFGDALVEELRESKRIGTAKSYGEVISIFKGYCDQKDLQFQQITYEFLNKFQTHHMGKGNSYNSLAVYMRTIRAIYNKAIKAGVVEKELYPFEDYKIKTVPTEKRALEWDLLTKIINEDIPEGHECFHARNYFLASYMMYGMNFTDMAFLERTDIANGRITYRRKKTSKMYDIKISEHLFAILNYYLVGKEADYVFPIIKRETLGSQYKDIQWARKRYNKKLKVLAELCGIKKNLTSYVSRHSFATQAMLQNVPLSAISAMLGHSSLKTTETYLKSLPNNILDDYNSRILQPT